MDTIVYSGRPLVLVTGATGNVGRPLTELLLAEGAAVRAVTRAPRAARLPDGAEVVGGDPTCPEAMADTLAGVTAVFVNPTAVREATGRLLRLARERGVGRVVLLSSATVQDGAAEQPHMLASWHRRVEDAVTGSGLQWTIVRPTEFASNVLWQWAQPIRAGVIRASYGEATTAPIHERDVADVAARALLSDRHAGVTYPLTGPQSLTRAEMVRILATELGRPLRFEEVPHAQTLQAMIARGTPQSVAEAMLALQAQALGRPAFVSPAVEQVTGSPGRTFARWVADHAADLA